MVGPTFVGVHVLDKKMIRENRETTRVHVGEECVCTVVLDTTRKSLCSTKMLSYSLLAAFTENVEAVFCRNIRNDESENTFPHVCVEKFTIICPTPLLRRRCASF